MQVSQKEVGFVKYLAFKLKKKHALPFELEDLVGIGLEAIVKANETFDPNRGSLNSYRYLKVMGAILDYARANIKRELDSNVITQDFVPIQSNVIDNIDNKEKINIVKRIIDSFDYRERKMLKLYYYEEKSLEDIADILGIDKSWASRLHAKALKKLTHCVMARVY